MDKLRDTLDVSLAVSLHAPNDEIRNQLVPLNRRYPISDLIDACHRFLADKNRKHSITFEYVMLDHVNDQPEHAKQLVKLVKRLPSKINLIPFNDFDGSGYQRSSEAAIDTFKDILQYAGLTTIVRRPRGEDIAAACGQLAGNIQDQAKRKRHYEKLYEADLLNHKVKAACA